MIKINFLKTTGFSLIEVLISLLLISLILFGLDAGQLYSIKEAEAGWFLNVANHQIANAIERLISLKTYDGLNEQLAQWNQENQAVLPSGGGNITGSFPDYVITVYWGNSSHHCKKQKIGSSGCIIRKISLV